MSSFADGEKRRKSITVPEWKLEPRGFLSASPANFFFYTVSFLLFFSFGVGLIKFPARIFLSFSLPLPFFLSGCLLVTRERQRSFPVCQPAYPLPNAQAPARNSFISFIVIRVESTWGREREKKKKEEERKWIWNGLLDEQAKKQQACK